MSADVLDLEKFVEKVEASKKQNKLDLSSDQDLSVAIMNLVAIEEHFFFTGAKTKKDKYFGFIKDIREMRKDLMLRLVKNPEGEIWCIAKHLLAAAMRLMEVGTKQLGMGRDADAQEFFGKAYQLYSLFWGLNLGAIDIGEVKKLNEQALNKKHKKRGLLSAALGKIVQKLIDCCIE